MEILINKNFIQSDETVQAIYRACEEIEEIIKSKPAPAKDLPAYCCRHDCMYCILEELKN